MDADARMMFEHGGEAQIYTGMRQEHSIGTMNSNHEPGVPHI